jgi:uncharacterized protein YigE (DUF2233 family)
MEKKQKLIIALVIMFFMQTLAYPATNWQKIAPGIDYAELHPSSNSFNGMLHAFRIDLTDYQLKLVFAKELFPMMSTMQDFVKVHHAYIGINGGFFTPQLESLGLRLQDGAVLNQFKPISWWGIFYIKDAKAHITSMKGFNWQKNISFAIQTGPRLVIANQIPALKPGLDERSALGITADGRVIIVATEGLPLTTQQLADILHRSSQQDGLDCVDALNLDGGSSTQLYARINKFALNVSSYKAVADAVIVVPRQP